MPKTKPDPGGHHHPHNSHHNSPKHHKNPMDKIKIKRVKRNKKKTGSKEKILAGLGVGGALMGGLGAVNTKPEQTQIVSTQKQEDSTAKGKITDNLKKIFKTAYDKTVGVSSAQANYHGYDSYDEDDSLYSPGQAVDDEDGTWYYLGSGQWDGPYTRSGGGSSIGGSSTGGSTDNGGAQYRDGGTYFIDGKYQIYHEDTDSFEPVDDGTTAGPVIGDTKTENGQHYKFTGEVWELVDDTPADGTTKIEGGRILKVVAGYWQDVGPAPQEPQPGDSKSEGGYSYSYDGQDWVLNDGQKKAESGRNWESKGGTWIDMGPVDSSNISGAGNYNGQQVTYSSAWLKSNDSQVSVTDLGGGDYVDSGGKHYSPGELNFSNPNPGNNTPGGLQTGSNGGYVLSGGGVVNTPLSTVPGSNLLSDGSGNYYSVNGDGTLSPTSAPTSGSLANNNPNAGNNNGTNGSNPTLGSGFFGGPGAPTGNNTDNGNGSGGGPGAGNTPGSNSSSNSANVDPTSYQVFATAAPGSGQSALMAYVGADSAGNAVSGNGQVFITKNLDGSYQALDSNGNPINISQGTMSALLSSYGDVAGYFSSSPGGSGGDDTAGGLSGRARSTGSQTPSGPTDNSQPRATPLGGIGAAASEEEPVIDSSGPRRIPLGGIGASTDDSTQVPPIVPGSRTYTIDHSADASPAVTPKEGDKNEQDQLYHNGQWTTDVTLFGQNQVSVYDVKLTKNSDGTTYTITLPDGTKKSGTLEQLDQYAQTLNDRYSNDQGVFQSITGAITAKRNQNIPPQPGVYSGGGESQGQAQIPSMQQWAGVFHPGLNLNPDPRDTAAVAALQAAWAEYQVYHAQMNTDYSWMANYNSYLAAGQTYNVPKPPGVVNGQTFDDRHNPDGSYRLNAAKSTVVATPSSVVQANATPSVRFTTNTGVDPSGQAASPKVGDSWSITITGPTGQPVYANGQLMGYINSHGTLDLTGTFTADDLAKGAEWKESWTVGSGAAAAVAGQVNFNLGAETFTSTASPIAVTGTNYSYSIAAKSDGTFTVTITDSAGKTVASVAASSSADLASKIQSYNNNSQQNIFTALARSFDNLSQQSAAADNAGKSVGNGLPYALSGTSSSTNYFSAYQAYLASKGLDPNAVVPNPSGGVDFHGVDPNNAALVAKFQQANVEFQNMWMQQNNDFNYMLSYNNWLAANARNIEIGLPPIPRPTSPTGFDQRHVAGNTTTAFNAGTLASMPGGVPAVGGGLGNPNGGTVVGEKNGIIITSPVPSALQKGTNYNFQFTATGGTGPYTWEGGGTVPAGMTFANGILSGTPTTPGTYSFYVSVKDSKNATVTSSTITVIVTETAVGSTVLAPVVNNITPASGRAGTSVNVVITGSNLTGATLAAATGSGITISNIQINSTGTQISATLQISASASAGDKVLIITTAQGATSKTFSVTSATTAAPTFVSLALSSASVSLAANTINSTITATVTLSDGTTSNNVTVTSNNSNATATVNASGVITITGSIAGTSTITVHPNVMGADTSKDQTISVTVTASTGGAAGTSDQATIDALNRQIVELTARLNNLNTSTGGSQQNADLANQILTLRNNIQTLTAQINALQGSYSSSSGTGYVNFSTSQLPSGFIGQNYNTQIPASSNSTLTFRLSSGQLPPGLTLNSSTGFLSGVPAAGGTYSFGITATNLQGQSNTAQFILSINSSNQIVTLGSVVSQPFVGLQMPVGYGVPGTGLQMPPGYPAAGAAVAGTNTSAKTYTVKKGDTLWDIAKQFTGSGANWRKILAANPNCLSQPGNTKTLKIGAVLQIP